MRALTKLRSWRPGARRTFAAFAGGTVIVAVGLGGLAGTAFGDAPGTPGETPIFAPFGGAANSISVLGPYVDAIQDGTTGNAASWTAGVNDNPAAVGLTTWTTGDTLSIDVTPDGGQPAQDVSTSSYVEFSGTPIVIVSGGASGATKPTFTTAVGTNPADNSNDKAAGLTDQLTITFTNSATVTGLTNFTLTILGIKYTVGSGTPFGPIDAFGTYTHASVGVAIAVPANATVQDIYATANTPPVAVEPGAINAAISPISVTELAPGIVQSDPVVGDTSVLSTGFICVEALSGKFTGSPTITVSPSSSGGTAGVVPVVSIINAPNPGTPPPATLSTLVAQVTASSTTTPTTFTFSNLTVDAPAGTGPVGAYVFVDDNSECTSGAAVALTGNPVFGVSQSGIPEMTIYTVATGHGPSADAPIFGSDAAQTAVASLEYAFPPLNGGGCVTNNNNHGVVTRTFHIGSTAVITDDQPGGLDGLTSAALAGYLGSGVLFTTFGAPTIDTYTLNALAGEGFTAVDIVGGPIAVSNAAMTELENTPSYLCGGSIERTGADGNVLMLQVHRIGGIDAATTAEDVADAINSAGGFGGPFPAPFFFGGAGPQNNISGALTIESSLNAMGYGYNQTAGTNSSSAPNENLRTAFLVTNQSAADASSASAEAYAEGIPILVTEGVDNIGTPAQTALLDLGIQNIIIIGGQLAVDNNISGTLMSEGYNVLRLAGTDLTQTSVDVAEWALNTDTTSNGQALGLDWGVFQTTDDPDGDGSDCSQIVTGLGTANPNSFVFSCEVTVGLATGDPAFGFADAESSSTVDGNFLYPLLLAQNASTLGQYVTAFFNAGGSPFGVDPPFNPTDPFVPWQGEITDTIIPFGGPLALQSSTVQAALNAVSAGANPS